MGMERKPIAIVGAGPTGATLGLLLAERGIPVVVIEASRNFRRIFRGEGLMPSGLEALAQMELLPIVEQVPHQTIGSWEFVIEGRSIFSVDEPMGNDRPCTLVAQPQFLATVIDRAKALPNFQLISGETVQNLMTENDRISGCVLSHGETIEASLVVGCDGRTSIVRKLADLSLNEDSKPFSILWFRLPDTDRIPQSNPFQVFVKGDAVFTVFRSSEGLVQVGWTVQNEDWKTVTNWSETLAEAFPPEWAKYFRSQNVIDELPDRPLCLTVTVGLAPQWSKPGCLLLGDAAHPMSPVRAQGINMALRDAIVATNYLVKAWRDQTDGSLLEQIDRALIQIQADRKPEIRRIQSLQSQEAADGAKLHHSAALRNLVKTLAPIVGIALREKWKLRQRELRSGTAIVQLEV
jgi:2-polyprenyl-6-methoxyphenol hydroxylase-like FAD-dependent oxidoreductase